MAHISSSSSLATGFRPQQLFTTNCRHSDDCLSSGAESLHFSDGTSLFFNASLARPGPCQWRSCMCWKEMRRVSRLSRRKRLARAMHRCNCRNNIQKTAVGNLFNRDECYSHNQNEKNPFYFEEMNLHLAQPVQEGINKFSSQANPTIVLRCSVGFVLSKIVFSSTLAPAESRILFGECFCALAITFPVLPRTGCETEGLGARRLQNL